MSTGLGLDLDLQLPKLLLHCCCAPCTSSVLERLQSDYEITVFFYNPNIDTLEEYKKRATEMNKLQPVKPVELIISDYCPDDFKTAFEKYPDEPEGGKRCRVCFELRLGKTVALAESGGYDFFTTTLSVSPHKDMALINEIGSKLAGECENLKFLSADFKKQDGYKRSIELSKQYGLYRQNYCGCSSSRTSLSLASL